MKQLDFLSYIEVIRPQQMSMFDESNRPHIQKSNARDVERFFNSIQPEEVKEHSQVWQKIKCQNLVDEFRRWLFAFMSVHTSYESNMRGYLAIHNWTEWFNRDPSVLKEKLRQSSVGLHNQRTEFITEFATKFWSSPDLFKFKKNQTWKSFRDSLVKEIRGLGLAKVSFALEMIYTFELEVFCADTHLFQAYGYDQNYHQSKYFEIESHWVEMSKIYNVSPAISRAIYWNRKKKQKNCWYWANVLA
jgi:thermostable 8-oxoguanine DNA glycosylase